MDGWMMDGRTDELIGTANIKNKYKALFEQYMTQL